MANRQYVTVRDGRTRAIKGVLGSAGKLGYTRKLNDLWEGSFTLPAGDAGNALIDAHDLIQFKDGKRGTVTMTTVVIKLENISNGVNEIKGELRGVREDVRDVRERQAKSEESLKSAWNRINELAQLVQALTCGGKD